MMNDLRPYPEYKESGLPWLGKIPAHWDVRRNGRLFAQRNETAFTELPILEVSLKTGVRVRDFESGGRKQVMSDRAKYKRAVKGDIAYNMMRMWQGAVGVAPTDGLVSPAYVVAKPYAEADGRYYAYLFRTAAYMNEVDKYSHGIVKDRNRLYWDEFKQMPSAFPPPGEQKAITDFLDEHGRHVRRFIRNKRQLIELLVEQKQAVINRAVTRGLDPSVHLKHSGIDGFGDAPESWDVVPLKRCARLHRGYDLPEYRRKEGVYPVVSSGGTIDSHSEWVAKGPGVVTGRYGSTGSVYCIESDFWPHNTSLYVCDFFGNLPRYIFYLLQTLSFDAHSGKSAVPGIDRKDLHESVVAMPSYEEQRQIADYLDRKLGGLDRLAQKSLRAIEVVHEYRVRLVTGVVTGKVDIRSLAFEAVEPMPDALETQDEAEEFIEDELQDADDLEPVEEVDDAGLTHTPRGEITSDSRAGASPVTC